MSFALGVLISGSGSNLQAILERIEQGHLQAEVKVVISNQPGAYGLERAKVYGAPVRVIGHKDYPSRVDHDREIVSVLQDFGVEAVVLAGYMRLVSKYFVQQFPRRIVNIHPGLLPAFKGTAAQQQAWSYGVKLAGATVHLVDEFLDHGPIIIQAAVPVLPGDDGQRLARRILTLEHRIYPQALSWLAQGRVQVENGRTVLRPLDCAPADITALGPCLINPGLEAGF